ncbi:unnamed protein product [Brachionus calyciflorus]|uniref:Hexosyltransferase n=1 Tax=Brachionus calyciflorus TaxID=104777 RepID=A0A814IE03_9BILA|nr:unnamed protein product [Brachionus calyciflorus]
MLKKNKIFNLIILTLFANLIFIFFASKPQLLADNGTNKNSDDQKQILLSKKDQIINPHNYKYIVKPSNKICGSGNLSLIAFVTTSIKKFQERQLIRQTWANQTLFPSIRTVFILGKSKYYKINNDLVKENAIYQDIVQEDFIDSYTNLTIKTIAGFKWVSKYCSNARYTLKIDDNVVVNTPELLKFFDRMEKNHKQFTKHSYFGYYDPESLADRKKIVLSKNLKEKIQGPFHLSPAYLVSTDLSKRFYKMSFYVKPSIFEDVYVGMLAQKLRTNFIMLNKRYFHNWDNSLQQAMKLTKKNKRYYFALCKSTQDFKAIWNKFESLSLLN